MQKKLAVIHWTEGEKKALVFDQLGRLFEQADRKHERAMDQSPRRPDAEPKLK